MRRKHSLAELLARHTKELGEVRTVVAEADHSLDLAFLVGQGELGGLFLPPRKRH
jgi:hypothetical protein